MAAMSRRHHAGEISAVMAQWLAAGGAKLCCKAAALSASESKSNNIIENIGENIAIFIISAMAANGR
jgi:hypothetical protein